MTNHEALRIIYEFCKENSEKDQKKRRLKLGKLLEC